MTFEEIAERIGAAYRSGKTIHEIAANWNMSPFTVKKYVDYAMENDV